MHASTPSRKSATIVRALAFLAGAALLAGSAPARGETFVAGALQVSANTAITGDFNQVNPAPTITEDFAGQWAIGTTFTLTAPTNFVFDTTMMVNATVIGGDLVMNNAGAETPAASTIVFSVNTASTVASTVRFPDIRLRAANCTGGTAGDKPDILLTASNGGTSLVNTPIIDVFVVPGPALGMLDATANPVTQAAGAAIEITLTARDLCGNAIPGFGVGGGVINLAAAGGFGVRTYSNGTLTVTPGGPNMAAINLGVVNHFDANGMGTFFVTSPVGEGPITISATAGLVVGMVNVNWVAASCMLTPPNDTNGVGQMHMVTATVMRNGAPAAGVPVSFNVTAGPNVGAMGMMPTNGAGMASFSYAGVGGFGIDTIQATGNVDGVPFLCTANKTWIAPVCVLDPAADTNLIGSDHTVMATVLLNGAFAAGVTVNFNVIAGPNAGANDMAVTDALGRASFTYTGAAAIGTDTIQASAMIMGVPLNCVATKEWINTGCNLSPPTDTNLVGDMHTVTATVLRNGVPPLFPPGVDVTFEVVTGPNVGTTDTVTTDAAGQADFTYTSNGNSGLDTIEATALVDSVPILCTATKDWVDPTCTLDPPTDVNLIGQMHTVTATVLRRPGVPAVGVMVNFNVSAGPNAGNVGAVPTNGAGQAMFTYMDTGGPGIDTIDAGGLIDGVVPFSCSATKEWIDTGCMLTPTMDTNQVGTAHTVTALVMRNGAPAQNVVVNFSVTAGPNAGQAGALLTDDNGEADFTYIDAAGPGTDMIEASGTVDGIPFLCGAMKEWINAACVLDPPTATNQVGTSHDVTATVLRNGAFAAGVNVSFLVTTGPNAGAMGMGVTNAVGEAVFNYNSNGITGIDTIEATAVVDGVSTTCSATKEWIEVTCAIDPMSDVNMIGTLHTVTATIRRNGAVVPGVTVSFDVTAGPNAGQSAMVVTDVNGEADFTYLSNGAGGTDSISAEATVDGVMTTCTASKEWIETGCSLNPASDANPVGGMHTVTVTVLRNGAPANGVDVDFSVANGPNFGNPAMATTNAIGEAMYTYMSNGATGVDTIEASGLLDGVPFSCFATKEWVVATCSLDPLTDTNLVGEMHTVTATVLRNGVATAGITVNFNVSAGPNAGLAGMSITNGMGEASFTYASNGNPGDDTIQASGSVDGAMFMCSATKTWIDTGCSLGPPSDTNQVNSSHTATVTVLNNGAPAPGVLVAFEITAGPNMGDTDVSITNAAGSAAFTYTGDGGIGVDTIEASGMISGVPFSCTATKEWIDAGCSLDPAADSNQVGTMHNVTATVTRNGAPQAGVLVQFNVTAGPNAGENDIDVTDALGQAVFSYTSNGTAGTDTIEAAATVDGVPIVCTATKDWIDAACSIEPVADSDVTGQMHSVTTTVTKNGAPAAGVNVTFSITGGPNAGLVQMGVTDLAGMAPFTYTGAGGPGVDMIQISGSVDGVPITCNATKTWQEPDGNGIDPDIEDMAPNNGDGNNDGIPDKLQPNVASLPDINGNFVTIVSPPGTSLENVCALPVPDGGIPPPDVVFPSGFFKFKVNGVAVGGAVDVMMILHAAPTVNTYYKFGPTPIIPVDHFYSFLYDGTTGMEVNANVLTLHFVDGLRGDGDLEANGMVLDPGAPALQADNPAPVTQNPCGLCSAGAATMMPLMLLGLAGLRRRRRR